MFLKNKKVTEKFGFGFRKDLYSGVVTLNCTLHQKPLFGCTNSRLRKNPGLVARAIIYTKMLNHLITRKSLFGSKKHKSHQLQVRIQDLVKGDPSFRGRKLPK